MTTANQFLDRTPAARSPSVVERCSVEGCHGALYYETRGDGILHAFCGRCEDRQRHEEMRRRYPRMAAMEQAFTDVTGRTFVDAAGHELHAASCEGCGARMLRRDSRRRLCATCAARRQRQQIARSRQASTRPDYVKRADRLCVTCGGEKPPKSIRFCAACAAKRREDRRVQYLARHAELSRIRRARGTYERRPLSQRSTQ